MLQHNAFINCAIVCLSNIKIQFHVRMLCYCYNAWKEYFCLANSNITDGGVEALTTGAAVGTAVVTTAVVFFMAGVLTGVLAYHCISKHQSQSTGSKPESSSHQQQQAGPQYEEVSTTIAGEKIELRRNMAYEPVKKIEMRENVAYGPVQHW